MREIKFRAWDKTAKEMGSWETIVKNKAFLQVLSNNFNLLIPMQYTGLKDKNSVEIYEGDIVKLIPNRGIEDDKESIGVVEYERLGYHLRINENTTSEAMWTRWVDKEVIGNIHENPELINNK